MVCGGRGREVRGGRVYTWHVAGGGGRLGVVGWVCEMYHHESPNPTRVGGWDSETSGEKSISHGKPYRMHFLSYITHQDMLVMLNTLHKVADHENHVKWIYLTTSCSVQWGKVRSMREVYNYFFKSYSLLMSYQMHHIYT